MKKSSKKMPARATKPARAAARTTTARKQAPAKASRQAMPKKTSKKPAAMDQEAMMAAWQKAMTPGDAHRRLEPMVGTFAARTTIWMEPGQDPQVSDGVSENRWALGERFVEQSYRGNAMGMPFEGLGYTGYDNVQKKYLGTWMDSCSTGIMMSSGIGRPSDRKMEFESTAVECTGQSTTFRCIMSVQDQDHHTFEMRRKLPNGKEFRSMLIEYTRK